ncbi:hypothetical protein TH25_19055 [Thalassospira profundimaris]|uniref:Uncharacterized protein n=1 Tax=Thalassospira profundimaris TaxID=502049 RepID=A0A367WTH8_9PROT|nr:hypothetical protein [Thalassospira profundimaris]RCK44764.1 hypothetical protein TH25_19055 [Thalassospira profundimaris]|tara:strand:+ start:75 stop:311 length:237 start_codon:yes stop_codon:yes gene_type:complete
MSFEKDQRQRYVFGLFRILRHDHKTGCSGEQGTGGKMAVLIAAGDMKIARNVNACLHNPSKPSYYFDDGLVKAAMASG